MVQMPQAVARKGGFDFVDGRHSNNASDASFILLIRSESVRMNAEALDLRYSRSSRTNWLPQFNGNLIDQALGHPGIDPQATCSGQDQRAELRLLEQFAQAPCHGPSCVSWWWRRDSEGDWEKGAASSSN